ncbi:hypothetical protein BC829DRAFT_343385, partial [Chytridium lagenaria]
ITRLNQSVRGLTETQDQVDQTLDYIESQQLELGTLLDQYEQQVRALYEGAPDVVREPIRITPADEEREKAYSLAETLSRQVDDMGRQLSGIIDEINSAKGAHGVEVGGARVEENPVNKIIRILDTHLTSLQWLDESTEEMGGKI